MTVVKVPRGGNVRGSETPMLERTRPLIDELRDGGNVVAS
jgi:hypothetical protein